MRRKSGIAWAFAIVTASLIQPAVAATGGDPPPACEVAGTAHGDSAHAVFQTRFHVDLAPGVAQQSGEVAADATRGWLGEIENGSGVTLSNAGLSIDSGRDPGEFTAANDGSVLASFPYSCSVASLEPGQVLQGRGIMELAPDIQVVLGYDSSRTVEPESVPAGGGEQAISVTLTPRNERFAEWSWISIFIDAGPADEVISLTGPTNLDAGETLHTMERGWTLVEGVLDKTYEFQAVIRYANDGPEPVRNVPGMQIYAFTQNVHCDLCGGVGSATFAVPELDGTTPGSGNATFTVEEAVTLVASAKDAYVTLYANEFEGGGGKDCTLAPPSDLRADTNGFLVSDTSGRLQFVDPGTGEVRLFQELSDGANFDIQYDGPQDLVIANLNGRVDRLDLVTRQQTTLVSGEPPFSPIGVAVGRRGTYYIADHSGAIYAYDSGRGSLTLLADQGPEGEPLNAQPDGIVLDRTGNVFFSDHAGRIYRIQPESRAISLVTQIPGASLNGMVFSRRGDLIVTAMDHGGAAGALFRVDPGTGSVTTIYSGLPFRDPEDVVVTADGVIYVMDSDFQNAFGQKNAVLYRMDPSGPIAVAEGICGDPVDILPFRWTTQRER